MKPQTFPEWQRSRGLNRAALRTETVMETTLRPAFQALGKALADMNASAERLIAEVHRSMGGRP